ncbi:cell adhesion molecule CEACAM5 isoform X3 [Vanacampus margaritifer]
MELIKIFGVIYFFALCAAMTEDYDYVTSIMWMDSVPSSEPPEDQMIYEVTSMFSNTFPTSEASTETQTVYEPPVPSLHLQSPWSDVFPFEKAQFGCGIIDSSEWTFTWYRNGQRLPDADLNVSSNTSNQVTLTIAEASQAHSGTYSCKAHHKVKGDSINSNQVELKVYANKPKPMLVLNPQLQKMFPGESVTFQCVIEISSGWDYLWYHDDKEIQGSRNNSYTIVSLALSDSGRYHCKAKRGQSPFYTEQSETSTLQVSEPPIPTMKLLTFWLDVFQMESVELMCDVGSPNWTFTWHRDGTALQEDPMLVLSLGGSLLNITTASLAHQGRYACKAHLESRRVSSAFSSTASVTVYENIPKPSLSKAPVLNSMYVGENTTFTCKVHLGSDWVYHWFKDGKQLMAINETFGTQLSPNDEGTYWCKATRGQRTSTDISDKMTQHVLEIPLPSLTLSSQWSDVFPTESVTFSCAMAPISGWTYTWHRDNQVIPGDDAVSYGPDGATLSIGSASTSHRGRYSCSGKLKGRSVNSNFTSGMTLKVYENIPKPSLSKAPVLNSMYVGENTTFTCKVHLGSDWVYHWFKDGKQLMAINETFGTQLSPNDEGTYWCKATRGQRTSTDISDKMTQHVLEIPLPSLTLSSQWSDVFPTESVTFSCAMAPISGWTYTWHRDNQVIPGDDAVSYGPDGATLSIGSASTSHRGRYSCSGKLKGRSVSSNFTSGMTLKVYDNKPIVRLEQDPEHMIMHTRDSVSYSCHINQSSGWEYVWYKDGTQLTASGKNYTIRSVAKTNAGSYKCQASRGRMTGIFNTEQSQALRLQFEERPSANIIVSTGWSEVFSTDSLVLKCEVKSSKHMWNYTWFMEGQQIVNSSSDKYTVTPQNDPVQSQYICQGVRSGRPSYSKGSDPLATRNLLLKRRVLLSISGCIFFGIVAVFFGCVVLRVTRKKEAQDEGPEEGELFLTMAQLKDRDDAPCPMVDYITDAELNVPAKEGADIICSEATLLPCVTSQDDQVVTTESSERPPAEESPMASFQH